MSRLKQIHCLFFAFSTNALLADFKKANNYSPLGETDSLYLSPDAAFVHPFINDVFGYTDKLLTGALKGGYLKSFENVSIETVGAWRLLTPAFKAKDGDPLYTTPIGRYADSLELKSAAATNVPLGANYGLKLQGSGGLNHIGNKGGKQVHKFAHQNSHGSLRYISYTDQPVGLFPVYGLFLGIFGSTHSIFQQQIGIGYETGPFMKEVFYSWNGLLAGSSSWNLGIEGRYVHQLDSSSFSEIETVRHEFAVGIYFPAIGYKPSIKYVSPYLKGDSYGQYFLDILNIYIPL